jgi:hypothetical protein
MRASVLVAIAATVTLWASGASADSALHSWHAGLNLRTELGTHPIRADGGIDLGSVELTLVLDPMFWTDGQHDIDLLSAWPVTSGGLAVLGGVRTTSLGLTGGRHWQDKLLLGVTAPIGGFGDSLRVVWGFELATVVVKHGADLPAEWISFDSGRDFIDLVNFAMFVRFDYASAL